jgi:HEAT repeat protein
MAKIDDFAALLEHLRDISRPYSMGSLYMLSDLSKDDLAALEAAWPAIPPERRNNIMQSLREIGEANFEVSFDAVYRLGLEDEWPEVRVTAINALWESEDPELIGPFVDFLQHDPEAGVRAAAASALGRYVYLGELEELSPAVRRRLEDTLLAVVSGADEPDVRRRALEAVAYSSRPEVPPLVEAAYHADDLKLQVSAVFAMGRNADARRWARPVRAELASREPELRFEAARAAGELELTDAGPALADLAGDSDTQVREAAIWSLGQIGGDYARETLENLLEHAKDVDEREFIEEALDNLNFTDEVHAFSVFAVDGADDGDDDELPDDLLGEDDDLFDDGDDLLNEDEGDDDEN